MLLLTSTSDKIQIITGTAVTVDVHASYVTHVAGVVTPGRQNTKISTATTTDVVLAPAAGERNVKTLFVQNVHASSPVVVTAQHTDGTNVIVLESLTLLADERLAYVDNGWGFQLFDANGIPKTNAGASVFVNRLQSDLSNSTTTAAKVTGLDFACGIGTWMFEYMILYQAAATTTGLKFGVNHSGTVTSFVYDLYGVDNIATAATAAMDQDALAVTGQVMAGWAARAKSTTAPMITISVDAANSDMFFMVSGLAIVTVAGNLELYHASEVAFASTVKAGTALRLTKVA